MNVGRRTVVQGALATGLGASLGSASAQAAEAGKGGGETIRTEVCVIGGGSGGIGAALAAARAGAKVVLLERDAVLGGTSTTAWIHTWEPTSGADGIPRELYERMKQDPLSVTHRDYNKGAPRRGGVGLPFEPRSLIYAAREALEETGRVRVLYDTTFYRARVKGSRIEAVEAVFRGLPLTVEADVFIDCTADGDVCAAAGCEYHVGEDPRSRYHEPSAPVKAGLHLNSCTLIYRVTPTGQPQKPFLPKGVKEGACPRPVHIVVLPNGDHLMNPVNMIDGNSLLEDDYSQLMRRCYALVFEHFHWLQGLKPESIVWNRRAGAQGYQTWTIAGIAPRLGIRESRRVIGEYVLVEADCLAGAAKQTHDDIITITDHAVDIHGKKHKIYEVPHGPYGVPYRCLLVKGTTNLMIASRAASFSHIAASSCRLCRTMMTLGQAAGTAAAQAVGHHVPLRKVDVKELQKALQTAGVAVTA